MDTGWEPLLPLTLRSLVNKQGVITDFVASSQGKTFGSENPAVRDLFTKIQADYPILSSSVSHSGDKVFEISSDQLIGKAIGLAAYGRETSVLVVQVYGSGKSKIETWLGGVERIRVQGSGQEGGYVIMDPNNGQWLHSSIMVSVPAIFVESGLPILVLIETTTHLYY